MSNAASVALVARATLKMIRAELHEAIRVENPAMMGKLNQVWIELDGLEDAVAELARSLKGEE